MPKITLHDGATKDFNKSVDIDEIAFSIGKGLAKATVAGFVNEELVDASEKVSWTTLESGIRFFNIPIF